MTAKLRPARSRILGTGMSVPEQVRTNADLEKMVETSDAWIRERSGIEERRILEPGRVTSDLATAAVRAACTKAELDPAQLDCIIVATITPDLLLPSCAVIVQHKLGIKAAAFDIAAACAGFVYALSIGDAFVASGQFKRVAVVGVEVLSRITDWTDRNTCVLFGDGAGAVVLQNRANSHGLLTAVMGADGSKAELLHMPGGGSRCPATAQSVMSRLHFLRMEGKETFKHAVQAMLSAANEAMRRCDVDITKIKCIIPHQANRRIIDAVGERLGARPDQLFCNLDRYGNTSAASVAIALDEAVSTGRIQRGDLVLLVVFGAGLTWGAAVIEW